MSMPLIVFPTGTVDGLGRINKTSNKGELLFSKTSIATRQDT